MPDLVKVGKTNRQPSLRAQELSGVTGVPTPFIVVYEQLVDDSDAAEEFVHTLLEQKGYRLAANREFFSAPVTEVVSAILSVPKAAISVDVESADIFTKEEPDDFAPFQLSEVEPWRSLWNEGQKHEHGIDDYLVDLQEATRLYKDAARLGCILPYMRLGNFFAYGQGVSKDPRRALEYYKEGAKKGNYACYLAMAYLFSEHGQRDNTTKCVKLFFRDRASKRTQEIEDSGTVTSNLACFLAYCTDAFLALPAEIQHLFVPDKDEILVQLDSILTYARDTPGQHGVIPLIENAQSIVHSM